MLRSTLNAQNRRIHTRYQLPSMYTEVAVRELESDHFRSHGHAYDISLGGMRFELDELIEPGTRIAVRIQLPGPTFHHTQDKDRRAIFAMATVVWTEQDDLDQGGPFRMACVFKNFCQPGDEQRLLNQLSSGQYSRAA
ncbi:MAG: PilZ domain-containing protein [Phycisphaerales bacterium JB050]